MFNLVRLWEMRHSNPPTSNDPHQQQQYNNLIWEERNGIAIGRAIMAWLAVAGWSTVAALLLSTHS